MLDQSNCEVLTASLALHAASASAESKLRHGLAHMSFSMSASLMDDCSILREEERAAVWARSLAASTALLRMEASCTAQARR